ncbi:MAG: acetyl-CoA carboxylase carboxyltransferase subunit beta [FCB group bacterium]|nr:acetyl-CoA carboxylase carboxyltransferase subunit beta [FCB group bacterium]
MDWFKRKKAGITTEVKKALPDGLWIKCDQCGDIIYKKQLDDQLYVCRNCGFHFRITADDYIRLLLNDGTFQPFGENILPLDPLKFKDSKKYSDRISGTTKKTGLTEAIKTGTGRMGEFEVVVGIMDFRYMGGSVGSVVGERLARAIDLAATGKPLIILSSSGGMRMQEGAISLMQMAKVSAGLSLLSRKKVPYISILTHPTTGGTTASFSMLGDVSISEPGALIGFAGPRVIKQTIGQDLPPGFQRAEFLLKHGMIDLIVKRDELKKTVIDLLTFFL